MALPRPAIDSPPLADAGDAPIAKSLQVIGLVVDGRAYAYLIKALSIPRERISTGEVPELARRHVVNQLFGDTAVSVTYCDLTGCARVFKLDHQARTLPLVVGGLSGGRMVLVYADTEYLQTSRKIPLAEHPFEVTYWGDWLARHPDSQIYLGG